MKVRDLIPLLSGFIIVVHDYEIIFRGYATDIPREIKYKDVQRIGSSMSTTMSFVEVTV